MRTSPLLLLACVFTSGLVVACDEAGSGGEGTGSAGASQGGTDADGGANGAGGNGDGGGSGGGVDTSGSGAGGGASGLVPVFVAVGDGGFTATSCDRGRTWTSHYFSAEMSDHSPWTAVGGIAFGQGSFAIGLGWGFPGHVLHSTTGLDFVDLPMSSFLQDGNVIGFNSSSAGVVHDGTSFLLFSNPVFRSDDGQTWTATNIALPPGSHQMRQVRAFPSQQLVVASLEKQYDDGSNQPIGHFLAVSADGGASWAQGAGYDTACSDPIQHVGDIEMLGDALLVGAKRLCRSTDAGATWTSFDSPTGSDLGDLFTDGTAFYATPNQYASSGVVLRSEDGLTWSELSNVGSPITYGAYVGGTMVAAPKGGVPSFYFSDDGATWAQGTFSTDLANVTLREIGVGMVEHCP